MAVKQILLKPQDAVVALKLALDGAQHWRYGSLANDLFLSPSEVHKSVHRCIQAGLIARLEEGRKSPSEVLRPIVPAILEFLEHGLAYAFPAMRGGMARGLPTAEGAPPLIDHFMRAGGEPLPVWPTSKGSLRGLAVSPLYPGVPDAAMRDPRLYACLALIDAIRIGRVRERELARKMLKETLKIGHSTRSA